MWVQPGMFGSGNSRVGMFLGVREHQQVVFGHNALLCGALEVNGAASDFCSGIPSGGGPCPPLESGITVAVCPCCLQTMHEAPRPTYPVQEMLHQLFLVVAS